MSDDELIERWGYLLTNGKPLTPGERHRVINLIITGVWAQTQGIPALEEACTIIDGEWPDKWEMGHQALATVPNRKPDLP